MSDKLSLVYRTDPFGFPLHAADEAIYRSLSDQKATAQSGVSGDLTDLESISKTQTNEAIDTPGPEIMDRADTEI